MDGSGRTDGQCRPDRVKGLFRKGGSRAEI
jgi:hypothetical protein